MDKELLIEKETGQDSLTFTITGRIYSSNADLLETYLEKALQEKISTLVLNMSKVEYISTVGIRIILKTYMDAKKAGGKLEIEMPSESVRNVLKITALDEMLVSRTGPQDESSGAQPKQQENI